MLLNGVVMQTDMAISSKNNENYPRNYNLHTLIIRYNIV